MSPAALLRFDDASVGYGRETIVAHASLQVRPGEVVGLVGPNGAGKSTLLRALTGEARLLGGAIQIAGRPLASYPARERAAIVAVVPQEVTAAFGFRASDFVALGRHPHIARFAAETEHDADVVSSVMARTDTAQLAHKPATELSGGDLQRLALAQALAQEPRLLLLDEPTSHLDLNHRLQVFDLVRELAADGLAVLAVFHDLDLAARYADRIAVVHDGQLEAAETPASVLTPETVRRVFGVRAVVSNDPVTGSVTVTPVIRDAAVAHVASGKVLVIGGSGVAAPVMRRLVLAGWGVVGGALNGGDADATVAQALGVPFVEIPPFAPMDDAAEKDVLALATSVDAVLVCEVPFGGGNVGNLRAAVAAGVPMVLVGGIDGRDFTGGEATRLWDVALAAGARQVKDADAADAALREIRG